MIQLLLCVIAHSALARVSPSSWWVPNLTLVGLVLAVVRAPHRWLLYATLAGLFTLTWTIRFAEPVFLTYLALGWTVRFLVRSWNAGDPAVQTLLVGGSTVVVTCEALWLAQLWSPSLLVPVSAHLVLTSLSVPCLRWLIPGRASA